MHILGIELRSRGNHTSALTLISFEAGGHDADDRVIAINRAGTAFRSRLVATETIGSTADELGSLCVNADVWLPLERKLDPEDMHWRYSYYVAVIARLKPGVSLPQARQDVRSRHANDPPRSSRRPR